jgi:hypothetical protein
MQKFREWLIGTYNGVYKIVLEPSMPSRQTVLIVILAFVIGLLWAYALAPIIYYDGDPSQLEQGWQNEWVLLLADRYTAVTSTAATGPEFDQSIINLLSAIDDPLGVVDALGITNPGFRALAEQAQPGKAAPPRPTLVGNLTPFVVGSIVMMVASVIIALVGRILIYPNIIEPIIKRLRGQTAASDEATQKTIDAMRAARAAEAQAKETAAPVDSELGAPVIRRMSVYLMGRGQYDDSFEIEDSAGMFLGECGAAISETVGEGEPAKVTAIEVWLFDKDDFVRTMTGVLASEYAYQDPALRSKLETKGDMVLMKPGAVVTLDTNSLRLQARVVEMAYGQGPLPPNSFLEKMTLEIAVWRKAGVPAAARPAAVPPPLPPEKPLPLDIPFTPPPVVPAARPATPAMPTEASPFSPRPPQGAPAGPPKPPPDDDPFGGTGDFTPIG